MARNISLLGHLGADRGVERHFALGRTHVVPRGAPQRPNSNPHRFRGEEGHSSLESTDVVSPRKVDVRLPGKGNSNSHGAGTVHQKHQWIRTSRLSIQKSLSRVPLRAAGIARNAGEDWGLGFRNKQQDSFHQSCLTVLSNSPTQDLRRAETMSHIWEVKIALEDFEGR